MVLQNEDRNKGVASEAIQLLCQYSFDTLNLHQLFANVASDNQTSIHLFKKMGFEEVGVKKDWIFSQGDFKNEILYQKISK